MPRSVPTTNAEVITVGVDTHKDIHVAVALDGLGRRLGALSVPTTPAGYKELVDWANGFGPLGRAGVEGTGSFGAGLTRFLRAEGIEVFEVIRPRRRDQYRCGKSDPIDAEAAASRGVGGHRDRSAQRRRRPSGDDPCSKDRASLGGEGACSQAANQLKALLVSAPEGLKSELCKLSTARLVARSSRLRPGTDLADVEATTK